MVEEYNVLLLDDLLGNQTMCNEMKEMLALELLDLELFWFHLR